MMEVQMKRRSSAFPTSKKSALKYIGYWPVNCFLNDGRTDDTNIEYLTPKKMLKTYHLSTTAVMNTATEIIVYGVAVVVEKGETV